VPAGEAPDALQNIENATNDLAAPPEEPTAFEDPLVLQPRHMKALRALANGCSVKEAARAAGVSRSTLHRWLTEHPAVRAAHDAWKSAVRTSAHNRLLALQDAAVDVLEEEINEKRNGKLAVRLLEKTGALAPPEVGPTRPDRAAAEIAAEQNEHDVQLAKRARSAEFDARIADVEQRFPQKPGT
jgi:transposase-like protein